MRRAARGDVNCNSMSEREKLLLSAKQRPILDEGTIGGTSGSFIACIRWWLENGVGITQIKLPRSAKGPCRAWSVALSVVDGLAGGDGHGELDAEEEKRGKGKKKVGTKGKKGLEASEEVGNVRTMSDGPSSSSPPSSHLFVYEEVISERNSTCDQCRIIGWGTHPVSSTRYHFIIPAETGPDSLDDGKSLVALTDAARRGIHPGMSFSLPSKPSMEGGASSSSSYGAQSTIFDSIKHRLHGVIHANGFGHLLRINGVYGGSSRMTGLQIFALWDALCDRLCARSVTVEDVSSKSGMELRIAYLLAYGCTWYGLLGYGFGRGPYNITEKRWLEAGAYVSSVNLSQLVYDFRGVEDRVVAVIQRYCLPVPGAVEVRDFGALMYRLMYLQLNPLQAGPFFDETCIDHAKQMCGQRIVAELPVKRKQAQVLGSGKKSKGEVPSDVGHGGEQDVVQGVKTSKNDRGNKKGPHSKAIREEDVHSKNKAAATAAKSGKKNSAAKVGGGRTRLDVADPPAEDHQLGMLRYRAFVGHEYMDRARMLLKCLRSLIPCASDVLDDMVTTEEEVNAMLTNLVEGPGAPPVTFNETWFEFLPEMLRWAQKLLGFRGVDAGAAIKITGHRRDIVEIDKGFLHRIKMYPETWVLPLKKATILKYNGVERDDVKIARDVPNVNGSVGLQTTDRKRAPADGRASGNQNASMARRDADSVKEGNARTAKASRGATKAVGSRTKAKWEVKEEEDVLGEDRDPDTIVEERNESRSQKKVEVATAAQETKVQETPGANKRQETLKAPTTIDEYVKMSVDATVDALWKAAVCPSEDDDAPMVPRPWHELEPGSAVDDPNDPVGLRNQITADLHLLFMCTLKLYIPEVAKIAGQTAAVQFGQKHVAKIVKGKQISKEVAVLRDTKHFVKTYRSSELKQMIEEMRDPGMRSLIKPGVIRVRTTLVMPEELTSPDTSTRAGKKAVLPVQPPTEIIDMPGSSSVGDYLSAVTKRYADMYELCKRFKAVGAYVSVEKEDNPKHPIMKKSSTVPGTFLSDGAKLKSLVVPGAGKATGKQQAILAMDVVGSFGNEVGVDWMQHAGGAQDWTVNCPCGTIDDDGAEMVACTKCETWFHTRCVKPDAPDSSWAKTYTCNRCLGIQELKSPRY